MRSARPFFVLVALAACSSPQSPFLGFYETKFSYSLGPLPSTRTCKNGCTFSGASTYVVTAGPGDQLILTSQAADGGRSCILTGTVQSSTAFTLDTETDQGCQSVVDDAGATVTTIVQSGAVTIDGSGDMSIDESGSISFTDGNDGLAVNSSYQGSLTGALDGG
jgi:hypothetical protein